MTNKVNFYLVSPHISHVTMQRHVLDCVLVLGVCIGVCPEFQELTIRESILLLRDQSLCSIVC